MFKVNNKDPRTTPSVSIVSFEQVNAGWVSVMQLRIKHDLINH